MELAKAYVQIIPSAQGISGSIANVINPEADSAGEQAGASIASKIKNAIIAAGIGKAISDIFRSALSEGGQLEQSLGGIETLFKDSSDKMKAYASEAYRTAGISANQYMQQSTSFAAALIASLDGDTAKAADYANRAIIDMSDNANKMGTSMEDIQNAYQGFAKQNYTMLDNLKLGYGGTKEEMARLISDASKMTDVQDELNVSVQDGDMSFGNIVNAISVMQKHLDITGTTSQEAATTLEGSFNSMKAAASDFLGNLALGNDIKPALNNLISTTSTYLFDNLFPAIGNIFMGLAEAIPDLASTGYNIALNLINGVSSGLSSNVTAFIDNVFPMLVSFSESLNENAGMLIDAGLNMLLQLVQGIMDGLPTMIETIPQIITNIANIINENMPNILMTGFQILVTLGEGIISAIPTLIANLGNIVTAIFSVWQAINWWQLGSNLISGIKDGIKSMFESLKTSVTNLFNGLKDGIVNIFNNIFTSAGSIWTAVKDTIVTIVTGLIAGVVSFFADMGSNVSGIFEGIKGIASSVWNTISSTISGVVNGIKNTISNVFNSVKNTVSSVFNSIKSTATSVWNNIKSAIETPINTAKNTVKSVIDAIKGFFNFKFSWPSLPLPHFSVKPKGWSIGDLLKGKIPSLGIDWYAKAMDDPMMLDGATIFGMSGGKLLGGGEAGPEYITGEDGLSKIVENVVDGRFEMLIDKETTLLEMIIDILKMLLEKDPNIVLDDDTLVGRVIDKVDKALYVKQLKGARGL